MQPPMTELDDLLIEDWSEASAPVSWSHEGMTRWTPAPQLLGVQPSAPRPRQTRDLSLYVACGAAALALGVLSSRAFFPLLFNSETEQPKRLFQVSPPSEDAGFAPPQAQPRTNQKKDAARPRKRPRAQQLTAASSNPQLQTRSLVPLMPASGLVVEAPLPPGPSVLPDLDLMDAPSSPLELRALADSRARSSANSQLLMEAQRQHDPMGKLDVLQDPGVELGWLRINSRPWSQVFIDDKPVGTTPLLGISVGAGEHSVRLVNPSFGMRKTFDVFVSAGESVSRVVSLAD